MTIIPQAAASHQAHVGQPESITGDPQAPCIRTSWCTKEQHHEGPCAAPTLSMPSSWLGDAPEPHRVMWAELSYDVEIGATKLMFAADGGTDWTTYDTGSQMRAYTAQTRAHLDRLDAMADQYDRIIAQEKLQGLLAQHKTHLVKVKPGEMPHSVCGFLDQTDGPAVLFLAEDNAPDVDLALARTLIAELNGGRQE